MTLPYPDDSPQALAARWVRWLAGFGPVRNPGAGARAGAGQPGDVWFLAGTFGGAAQRRVTLPATLPLFFPVVCKWYDNAGGPPAEIADVTASLTLDGAELELETIATPEPFEVRGAFWNPVTGTKAPVPVTVWGLWRRLDPLAPGDHIARWKGSDGFHYREDTTLHLTSV